MKTLPVLGLLLALGCTQDSEPPGRAVAGARLPAMRTAYIEVKGMIQQLGIT